MYNFEVDGDIMKNIKVKKTVYIVLVILGLFIAQTFASKLGGFIADLIQCAVIDKDGTFMSISVHHIIQMIVALVLIFVISKKSDLEFWLKPRLNKSGILYTTIFDIVILMYVLISYIVGYSLNTIVPYAYECQTAHCGRGKPHFIFGGLASPMVPYRNLPQASVGMTADCRSLV